MTIANHVIVFVDRSLIVFAYNDANTFHYRAPYPSPQQSGEGAP